MHKVNQLAIVRDNHKTQEGFENAIRDAITLLLDNDYIMTVRYDANDKNIGVVVIDYEAADESWGAPYPYWLKPEDVDNIEMTNKSKEGY